MAAPTREEIRLATLREWTRKGRIRGGPQLRGQLVDLVGFELACGAFSSLYESPDEGEDCGVDDIFHEVVDPIIAEAEASILEAVATALERFAREYPDAPRAAGAVTA